MVRAVRAEAGPTARAPFSIRFGRRFAPALGAAALLAIVAVGVITLTDDLSPPAPGTGVAEDVEDAESTDTGTLGADDDAGSGSGDAGQTEELRVGDTAAEDPGARPKAAAGAGAQTTESQNATLAASATVGIHESFAGSRFDPSLLLAAPLPDARNERAALRNLAASAPNPELARTIRSCASGTLESSALPLVPTYAAYFTSDDIIVIGFVWTDSSTATLNFVVHGWRGRDCDPVSPIFRRGELP